MASDSVLATSLTLGTIASGVLAYLKSAKWAPWFNKHSAKINHIFMAASSAGGAIGIHAVWDSTNHALTITGLSLIAIWHGAWEWTKQWTVQYLVHRGVFGPVSIPGDAPAIPAVPVTSAGNEKKP